MEGFGCFNCICFALSECTLCDQTVTPPYARLVHQLGFFYHIKRVLSIKSYHQSHLAITSIASGPGWFEVMVKKYPDRFFQWCFFLCSLFLVNFSAAV